MDFVQIYYFNTIKCFLNTVITLAPVLMYNLKHTVESNTNYLNKKYYYYLVTKCVTSMYLLIPLISLDSIRDQQLLPPIISMRLNTK